MNDKNPNRLIDREVQSILNKEIEKERLVSPSSGSLSKKKASLKIDDDLMKPSLIPGDRVTIEPSSINQLKVGNLVVLSINNKPVVRRVARFIVDKSDIYLVARDDSRHKEEKPVKDIKVIGVVSELMRDGKKIKVPDTSNFFDMITNFKHLTVNQFIKELITRLMPFSSGN